MLDMIYSTPTVVVTNRFRCSTDRRAAAIALAIALYRFDHNGIWPGSLEQLVPTYLPSVPLDPLAGNSQPFKYSGPNAATQRFVYSVGEDGIDNGGSTSPLHPKWNANNGPPWGSRDAVYHLTPQPRTIDDSTSDSAEDHPADQNGGGGNSK